MLGLSEPPFIRDRVTAYIGYGIGGGHRGLDSCRVVHVGQVGQEVMKGQVTIPWSGSHKLTHLAL